MPKSCLEAAIKAAVHIFIKGLVCDARRRRRDERMIEPRLVVSVMGDTVGYIINDRLIPIEDCGGH